MPFKSLVSTTVAAAALVFIAVVPAQAKVIIDDFGDDQLLQQTGPGTVSGSVLGANILGGERDSILTVDSGPGLAELEVSAGSLKYSNQATVTSHLQLQYDGADGSSALDAGGLGGVDISTLLGFAIEVLFTDIPVQLDISLYTDAANFSTAATVIPGGIGSATTFFVPFAAFVTMGGTGIDLADLGAITFDFVGGPAFDLAVDVVTAVPEPLPLAMFGIGLIAMGALRRRKATKAASPIAT